jgi:hypothetical protein
MGPLLFLRRIKNMTTSKEITPITPREAPKPIPTFAPVERSVVKGLGVVEEANSEAVDDKADVKVDEGDDEDGKEDDEDDEDGGVEIACTAFQPTTAIAPTVDSAVKVVVAITHESVAVAAVDAYVRTAPADTSDKQSPVIWPGIPPCR